MSRVIENTLLGEAGGGTRKQRFGKMVRALSTIAVRAAQTGETWESVAAGQAQYSAYNHPAPGSRKFRDLARQAIAYVRENGPVVAANYYALPGAVKDLPEHLTPVTHDIFGNRIDDDHRFFSDDRLMRNVVTAAGPRRLSRPASEIVSGSSARAPTALSSPGNLPDTAPTPMARPLSPIAAPDRFGLRSPDIVDPGSRRVASAFGDPNVRSFTPRGVEVSLPVTPAEGFASVATLGRASRSPMDNVTARDWSTFSLPPGADARLSNLSVYSPERLAASIGETRALVSKMPSARGHLSGVTPNDIDAVIASRASGPNPTEAAARIAAYRDPANIPAAQTANRLEAARRANEALSSYTSAATPQASSIRERAFAANQGTTGSIPGMLAGMDALGRPNAGVPVDDTRREAVEEAREQVRLSPYDRAMIPTRATTMRFTPDLRPIAQAPAPAALPYQSGTYGPPNPKSPALRAIERVAPSVQPTIAAPQSSPAPRDMRNVFPPAPAAPTQVNPFKSELVPALGQAFVGGLFGGPLGAAIGLAGGLLGNRPGGLLGALGPGFDAALPSSDRFSTGSGLGGIMAATGGPRGAQGFSRSNPGMSYTSLGGNLGGLRRSERFGWTEHVAPDGSVTGISYDNGGGGLLGGLSRGLGSLFGGADTGSKGKKSDKDRDSKGRGRGLGPGLY